MPVVPLHREERNAYARQLRQMLESGDLSEPFTTPPSSLGTAPSLSWQEKSGERWRDLSVGQSRDPQGRGSSTSRDDWRPQ